MVCYINKGTNMTKIDLERLNVADTAVSRLLGGLKSNMNLRGKALRRMKLVEYAKLALEEARLL